MNDKLRSTLEKIEALAKQNPEFALELQKIAKCSSPANSVSMPNSVADDIAAIRTALSIKADKSISYDFVVYQRMSDQLTIDNLRMENARLDLSLNEIDRYMLFCVNAFYQVESIINYYFYRNYGDINDLVCVVEMATCNEHDKYRYKSTGKELNVGSIPIAHKINAIYNLILLDEVKRDKVFMGKLKGVRNDFSHRGGGEVDGKSNEMFNDFYKKYTFDSIRISLKKLVQAVKDSNQNDVVHVNAVVSTVHPSACYVKYQDKIEMLPNDLYLKCKNIEQGRSVKLTIVGGKIINAIYESQDSANSGVFYL